jgi:hypothetical protein
LTSIKADRGTSPHTESRGAHAKFQKHEETVIGHGRHEELHAMLKDLKKRYLA